ncbi:hypothetical protein BC831DRAFT_284716 [Entophlyctis helioformis]|nr:hypothetical protein BC831DRAFT_284716 [Entophlyctis helioformis]
MVGISAFLGNLILTLISRSNPVNDYLYCSKLNATDSIGVPLWNETDPNLPVTGPEGMPAAVESKVYHTNWARFVPFRNGPPGAGSFNSKRPCVYWYEEDYPQIAGSVYEPVSGAAGNLARDASFTAQPIGGWFNSLATGKIADPQTLTIFQNLQLRAWAIYGADPSVDLSLVGVKPPVASIPLPAFAATPSGPSFTSPANASTGLLGTIPNRYFLDFGSFSANPQAFIASTNVTTVPWYQPVRGGGDSLAMDDAVSAALDKVILEIAKVDKSVLLRGGNADRRAVNELFRNIGKILQDLPNGGVYFTKIDHALKKYAFQLNFGTDIRLAAASNFPRPGSRLIYHLTQLTNSIFRNSNPARFGSAKITHGFRIMPQITNTKINFAFGGLIGSILYPFGVSFLLPIFTIILVQEKEARILVMMKMNGMKTLSYYVSHYVTFFILYAVSTAIFLGAGYVAKLSFFTLTESPVYVLLFFIWGNVQIALAFFFATLFNRSRLALIIVFLAVLCSVIISLAVDQIYQDSAAPITFFIWPPFAFYRALGTINRASYLPFLRPLALRDLAPGNEVYDAMIFMIVEIALFLGLAGYLNAVFPSEFGVQKPWHFPITDPINAYKRAQRKKANGGVDPKSEAELALSVNVDAAETQFEDADVKAERARVDNSQYDPASPLVMKHMRKVYGGRGGAGPKLAVKDVTFAVEEGIVFGLLGPNGAGKTTLISILTGLYEASTGFATIGGYDVKTQTSEVYKRVGICPQFDILWEELTVGEHLYFYARLKGIPAAQEKIAVAQALTNVSLTAFENRLTKGLSGGEKRRLSIAIALLGSPSVVFLDEPTTGLDPEVRRLIWNIVNEARLGKTIVLTTHSMEEAEALCQRIGIMAKGTLRCLANPIRLKQTYGSGFRLYFNSLIEDTPRASAFLESILPVGWTKLDAFATNTSYEFPPVDGVLSYLFEKIEAEKANYGILDWGIGQTTLEEVFIRLINDDDAGAD